MKASILLVRVHDYKLTGKLQLELYLKKYFVAYQIFRKVRKLYLPPHCCKQNRITQPLYGTVLGELPLPLLSAAYTWDARVEPPSELLQRTRCLHRHSFKEVLFPYVSVPSHVAHFPLARLVQYNLLRRPHSRRPGRYIILFLKIRKLQYKIWYNPKTK